MQASVGVVVRVRGGGHVCGPIMSSNAIPSVGACQRAVAAPRFHSHFAHLCSSPPGCSSRGQLSRPQLSLAYSAPTQGILLIAYSRNQGTALMHGEGGDEVAPPGLGGPTSARVSLHARARACKPVRACSRARGSAWAFERVDMRACERACRCWRARVICGFAGANHVPLQLVLFPH